MQELTADFVVIGSGPAGQKAAVQAAKLGKKVIIIEKGSHPGGSSLNFGTIPSKSLREAILDLTDFYHRSFYGQEMKKREISINDLNYRLHKVLEEQRGMLLNQFSKNQIEFLFGTAHFQAPHELLVVGEKGEIKYQIRGEFFLIATGSSPRNPSHVPFDHKRVLDSTRLLSIDRLPKTLLVLGGGIIGSEYASFFSALGSEVTLVDKGASMLPFLDQEISLHLQTALSKIGLKFLSGKVVTEILLDHQEVITRFADGTELYSEMVLYALGRVANVEDLCIEKAGLSLSSAGFIPVNSLFQTVVPHIYAAGDVIGTPALASTSMEQGRLVARDAFGAKTHPFPDFYPVGIYTIPEISSCGYTEQQLNDLGFHFSIGRAYYYEIARNQIVGNDPGMFKILFHTETLQILGIHIIGRAATELIHIGQVAMSFNARIDYFINQIFNYPTYAEGYRIAALNGFNKLKK